MRLTDIKYPLRPTYKGGPNGILLVYETNVKFVRLQVKDGGMGAQVYDKFSVERV